METLWLTLALPVRELSVQYSPQPLQREVVPTHRGSSPRIASLIVRAILNLICWLKANVLWVQAVPESQVTLNLIFLHTLIFLQASEGKIHIPLLWISLTSSCSFPSYSQGDDFLLLTVPTVVRQMLICCQVNQKPLLSLKRWGQGWQRDWQDPESFGGLTSLTPHHLMAQQASPVWNVSGSKLNPWVFRINFFEESMVFWVVVSVTQRRNPRTGLHCGRTHAHKWTREIQRLVNQMAEVGWASPWKSQMSSWICAPFTPRLL